MTMKFAAARALISFALISHQCHLSLQRLSEFTRGGARSSLSNDADIALYWGFDINYDRQFLREDVAPTAIDTPQSSGKKKGILGFFKEN